MLLSFICLLPSIRYSYSFVDNMAREEKNKYSNIEHVRTNMLWMDIKIVDPEMEALMKQINEEQTRLKEALREKLRLMKFDNDIIQKENEQTKEWLRSKGIQFEEKKNNITTVKEENASKVKTEPTDTEASEKEHREAKVSAQNSKETDQTKEIINNTMEETNNIDMEPKKQDGNQENESDISSKSDNVEEGSKTVDKGEDNASTNDETVIKEPGIASRTRRSVQIVEPIEDVLYTEKRSRRGMKRRKVLKKYKTGLKRRKDSMEKIDEMDSSEDGKEEGEP